MDSLLNKIVAIEVTKSLHFSKRAYPMVTKCFWVGILGITIVGHVFFEENLTGTVYIDMFEETNIVPLIT